ncbi:O-antigen ligase family protein [Nakamurella multipartita]|nr:O-antigen ligase family protein [Nakamurella multipartita]
MAKLAAGAAYIVLLAGKTELRGPSGISLPLAAIAVPALLALLLGPIAAALRRSPERRASSGPMLACAVLFAVLALSSLWSEAGEATWLQLMWIVLMLGVLCVVSAAAQLSPKVAVDTFMLLSAVTGIIFAVGGLVLGGSGARLAAFGGGPNVFARITGIGIIAAVFWMLRGKRGWPALLAFIPVMAVANILSGSRGALIGTVCGLLVVCVAFSWRTWLKFGLCTVVASPILFILYGQYGANVEKVVALRIVKLTFEEGYTSGRDTLWEHATSSMSENPVFGTGLGSFMTNNGFYTHNLFLQVGVDAGLLGLAVLTVALLVLVRGLWTKNTRSPVVLGPLAAGTTIFVASMVSGDHYDTRFFWAYLILACAAAGRIRSKTSGKAGACSSEPTEVPPHRI